MNNQLTILERMILECLQCKPKKLSAIGDKTQIKSEVINKIMSDLIAKNIVVLHADRYEINRHLSSEIKDALKDEANLICEIHEIINSCLRKAIVEKAADSFHLKKVNMSEREEKIYLGLKYNLITFLESLNKTDDIAKQKIIFWGEGHYANIKNSILNY